jgi:hypothetical protein
MLNPSFGWRNRTTVVVFVGTSSTWVMYHKYLYLSTWFDWSAVDNCTTIQSTANSLFMRAKTYAISLNNQTSTMQYLQCAIQYSQNISNVNTAQSLVRSSLATQLFTQFIDQCLWFVQTLFNYYLFQPINHISTIYRLLYRFR